MSTEAERTWLPTPDDNWFSVGSIRSITWSPDSKRLAFEFSYEGSGVYLLDATAPGGRLEDLSPLRTDESQSDDVPLAPTWRSDGKIVVGSICCHPDMDRPQENFVVDPDTGEAARFSQAEDFSSLDFDGTGRHLLYVKGDKGELFRQTGGDKPVLMANDFLEAEW